MMETLKKLLERYDGITPPMRVQTDLSGARAPSYALSQRNEQVWEDVLGRRVVVAGFTFHLRRVAAGEADRQGAHAFLTQLGLWLAGQVAARDISTPQGQVLTYLQVGPPLLQEAYDDGTAGWSIALELRCEPK